MELEKLNSERSHIVVKSNDLIRKARYSLSLNQQKLILYAISKIKPDDVDFAQYDFALNDLCDVMGVEKQYTNRKYLVTEIKSIMQSVIEIATSGKTIIVLNWFVDVEIEDNSVKFRFHPALKPYLIALHSNFTAYRLEYAISMKSKYSIRLYELLKSRLNQGYTEVSVDGLRESMIVDAYTVYADFKRWVISPAVKEINTLSDIVVGVTEIKTGKRVSKIGFSITKKDKTENMISDVRRYTATRKGKAKKQNLKPKRGSL